MVQEQSNAMKDTTDQIKLPAATVEKLMKSQPQSQSMGLRLHNLVLPEFTGKEPLNSFLKRIQSLLITPNVPVQYWLTYLKQQCQKDSACIRRTELGTRGTSETVRAGCHESRSCGTNAGSQRTSRSANF